MELGRFLCLLFLISLTCFLPATEAYKHYVGGRDGWVSKPSESYDHWAQTNRFQVNDTLYFKYNKGSDSVLVVNKDSYFNCSTSNPIQKLDQGNSEFKFDHSGPFYFISGKNGSCANGQKLIVIVLAVRHPKTPPSTQPPSTPPSSSSSPSPSPSYAPSANPVTSPVPAPEAATTPTSSPPSQVGTAPTPSGDVPSSGGVTSPPGTTPTPSGDVPSSGDVTSPPPGSNQDSTAPNGNGAYGVTASSSVLVSLVVVLVSLAFMMSSF